MDRNACLALALAWDTHDDAHNNTTSGQHCWHCCHEYTTTTVRLPIRYDDRKDRFTYIGQFCSWSCAKSHALDHQRLDWCYLLAHLKRIVLGKRLPTVPAPPRHMLEIFGGTMTLDEFRSVSDDGIVVSDMPSNMIPLDRLTKRVKVNPTTTPGPSYTTNTPSHAISSMSTDDPDRRNESLRLKRPAQKVTKEKSGGLDMFLRINNVKA